jgi:hypothetical protein
MAPTNDRSGVWDVQGLSTTLNLHNAVEVDLVHHRSLDVPARAERFLEIVALQARNTTRVNKGLVCMCSASVE